MSAVFIKSTAAVEQGYTLEYDQRTGFHTIRRFRGEQSFIEAKEAELMAQGYNTRKTQGPVWELEATIATLDTGGGGAGDLPVDTWELLPNVAEKDILASNANAVKSLIPREVADLRAILDGKIDTSKFAPAYLSAAGQELYAAICAGVKSRTVYQPILRHTRTVSAAYTVPASIAGNGQVFSSRALVLGEGVPALLAGSFPVSVWLNRNDDVRVYYGWLKTFPTIQLSAFSKSQIVQEWQWGEWASVLYTVNE